MLSFFYTVSLENLRQTTASVRTALDDVLKALA